MKKLKPGLVAGLLGRGSGVCRLPAGVWMLWLGRGSSRELFGYFMCQVCRTAPDWTNSTRLVDFCQQAGAGHREMRTFGPQCITWAYPRDRSAALGDVPNGTPAVVP